MHDRYNAHGDCQGAPLTTLCLSAYELQCVYFGWVVLEGVVWLVGGFRVICVPSGGIDRWVGVWSVVFWLVMRRRCALVLSCTFEHKVKAAEKVPHCRTWRDCLDWAMVAFWVPSKRSSSTLTVGNNDSQCYSRKPHRPTKQHSEKGCSEQL